VVLQEIFGLNKGLRQTCDELASEGYVALSPDLFWRMEPGVDMSGQSQEDWERGLELCTAFDQASGLADIALTLQSAKMLPETNGRVGLMGYCFGGLMTFITTARQGADASVVYYGGQTEKYLGEARDITNPMLMHLAEEDEYIPKDARDDIVEALAVNDHAKVFTYPGCSHAFARHGGKHYLKAAADLASARTSAFLALHLKGAA
jgi:carboxymethylenebutenolidase